VSPRGAAECGRRAWVGYISQPDAAAMTAAALGKTKGHAEMPTNDRSKQPRRSFSERHGYRPVRSVFQVDSMDEPLRNVLLSALDLYVLSVIEDAETSTSAVW
jgi:hypothetical protein